MSRGDSALEAVAQAGERIGIAMTLRLTLDRKMLECGVGVSQLASGIGITAANLSALKNGRAKAVRFSTLNALCRALRCQPGALLQFAPETPAAISDNAASPSQDRGG